MKELETQYLAMEWYVICEKDSGSLVVIFPDDKTRDTMVANMKQLVIADYTRNNRQDGWDIDNKHKAYFITPNHLQPIRDSSEITTVILYDCFTLSNFTDIYAQLLPCIIGKVILMEHNQIIYPSMFNDKVETVVYTEDYYDVDWTKKECKMNVQERTYYPLHTRKEPVTRVESYNCKIHLDIKLRKFTQGNSSLWK